MSPAIRVLNMGKRGIVIGFAEPSLLSRLPMFFLLADRIEVSGLRCCTNNMLIWIKKRLK